DPYRFVILLTARGRPEDRRAGLEAGADDFMVKPMDMGDLIPRLSIAERMLRLEDAVSAKVGRPPAPNSVGAGGEGTEASRPSVERNDSSVSPPVPTELGAGGRPNLPGEEAAKQIILSAIRDFDAGEVHLEPQKDGEYKARVRTPSGTLYPMDGDAQAAARFFVLYRKQTGKVIWNMREGDRAVAIATDILPIRSGGHRVFLSVLYDSNKNGKTIRLVELPMTDAVREQVRIALSDGRRDGGLLFVRARRADQELAGRTMDAIKTELTDDETLVLDIVDIAYEQSFDDFGEEHGSLGIKTDQGITPLMVEQMTGLQAILNHRPDVVIARELVPYHPYFSGQSSVPFFVGSEVESNSGHATPYPYRQTLYVLPLLPDGANAQDRFRFESGQADDYLEEPYDVPDIGAYDENTEWIAAEE
ncbi:MAG: hypothetical protein H8F28_14850, partial [Fibrella sp.]|nr:hypothetical protein [Armatimonadota bacterium]